MIGRKPQTHFYHERRSFLHRQEMLGRSIGYLGKMQLVQMINVKWIVIQSARILAECGENEHRKSNLHDSLAWP